MAENRQTNNEQLTRRERQIMDILFELGEATAEEIRERLPEAPGNSAVRAMLARLEKKGSIRHQAKDLRYVYEPALSRTVARRSAVQRLIDVFFEGSVAKTVTALVELPDADLSEAERERLARLIRESRVGEERER